MEYTLYRAVTQREYNDIVLQGNRFRCIEQSLGAKQFAVTEECGHYYGKEIVMRLDRVPYILLQVIINIQEFCNNVMQLDDCNGVSIEKADLDRFNGSILQIIPLNLN